ncbi:MAG: hypothetical protein LBU31_02940 [Coriobacteriales bacterium]|jgi:hypothetical protein|nr:hypothetical protein [Coriobacteriales bacterium]
MYDPVFMLVLLVGCLALGGSLIMMCVIIHLRESACKNVECSYHPQSLRVGKDFSQVVAPAKPLSTAGSAGKGDRGTARITAEPASRETAKDKVAKAGAVRTERLRALPPLDHPQPPRAATVAEVARGFDDDEPTVDEPRMNSSMAFTDDMIQQVLAALGRQEERQLQMQAEQQRLQKQQRLMLRRQLRQTQRSQRTLPSFAAVPTKVFEKERTGQRAAIEWLITDRRRNQPALQAR